MYLGEGTLDLPEIKEEPGSTLNLGSASLKVKVKHTHLLSTAAVNICAVPTSRSNIRIHTGLLVCLCWIYVSVAAYPQLHSFSLQSSLPPSLFLFPSQSECKLLLATVCSSYLSSHTVSPAGPVQRTQCTHSNQTWSHTLATTED